LILFVLESAIAFAFAVYLALGENKDLQLSFDFATNEFFLKGELIEKNLNFLFV